MNSKNKVGIKNYDWKEVIKWLILIEVIYALIGGFLVSSPFAFYTHRAAAINYSRIFYLHGLTVGLAGITALLVSQTYDLQLIVKKIIFYFTIATILIGVTGGAINRSMKYKFTLWYQVLSLACLDVILISLFVGLLLVKNQTLKKSLSYWVVLLSSFSAMCAALIGDIAGFILDFGNWPGICNWYAHLIGFTLPEWQDALIRSHSDMIVVSVLALLLSIINWQYGQNLSAKAEKIRKIGEILMIVGLVSMLLIYLISAFGGSGVKIPHLFTEKGLITPRGQSVRGVDLGDFVIGIFIFLGGIIISGAISFGNHSMSKKAKITMRGIFFVLCFIVLTVGCMGMLEEYRADLFNSDVLTTPLGNLGFAFRLLHVNVALLLFPAVILMMLLIPRYLNLKKTKLLQWIFRVGIGLCFLACVLFMLINPKFIYTNFALWILYAGLAAITIAILLFIFSKRNNNSDPQ